MNAIGITVADGGLMQTVKEIPIRSGVECVDLEEKPRFVLKAVDFQLKEHGLEIVHEPLGDGSVRWYIARRGS